MKRLVCCAALALSVLGAGPALAQPGAGHGPRWSGDDLPGWAMMSRQEREEHRRLMAEFKSEEECRAYIARHHEQMAGRAKQQGRKAPGQPRRDPCSHLKR